MKYVFEVATSTNATIGVHGGSLELMTFCTKALLDEEANELRDKLIEAIQDTANGANTVVELPLQGETSVFIQSRHIVCFQRKTCHNE